MSRVKVPINEPFCLLKAILISFQSEFWKSDPAPNTYQGSTAWDFPAIQKVLSYLGVRQLQLRHSES